MEALPRPDGGLAADALNFLLFRSSLPSAVAFLPPERSSILNSIATSFY
jgi:hypothetical protein